MTPMTVQTITEVKESRELDRLTNAITVAKEAGLGSDSQAVLMANELAQEIRHQQARARREAEDLAAQHAAVHHLSNRERSQITTVYNAFKNKQTGAFTTQCQHLAVQRVAFALSCLYMFLRVSVYACVHVMLHTIDVSHTPIGITRTGAIPAYHLKTLFLALGVKIRTRAIRVMLKKIDKISTDPGVLNWPAIKVKMTSS